MYKCIYVYTAAWLYMYHCTVNADTSHEPIPHLTTSQGHRYGNVSCHQAIPNVSKLVTLLF
jgi:hypothetical protein